MMPRIRRLILCSGCFIREYHAIYPSLNGIDYYSNVDRLLAIWQGLHPDSFVESHVNPWPTFTAAPYTQADRNTREFISGSMNDRGQH
jgi:hypothetical protein